MVFVMEPIDKKNKDFLRPRLSVKEAGVIAVILAEFVKSHEALKDDVAVVYVSELAKRFSHLAEGSKFLRPRR